MLNMGFLFEFKTLSRLQTNNLEYTLQRLGESRDVYETVEILLFRAASRT